MSSQILSGLKIRKATIEDLEAIETVMKLSMETLGEGYYTAEQISYSCKFVCVPDQQIISDGTYYVVENEGGEIVGCGGWSFRPTLYAGPQKQSTQDSILDPKKDMARIRAMFVLPSCSGLGVGSLILESSISAAKEFGFTRGSLGATRSGLAFYKAKGWIVIKEELAVLPDGVELEVTHMEKIL